MQKREMEEELRNLDTVIEECQSRQVDPLDDVTLPGTLKARIMSDVMGIQF